MGSVVYRRITNVYEIPNDILVEAIGKGLTVNRIDPPVRLETSATHGLGYNEGGDLVVLTGDGVHIDHEGKLTIEPGCGIIIGDDCRLAVDPAGGLIIDDNDQLAINAGNGLRIDENDVLGIDTENLTETIISVLVDSNLGMEANELVLTKSYSDYKVLRNCLGIVISIELSDSYTKTDRVPLGNCYGYGYGMAFSMSSERKSSPELPNFYAN